jgi:hypothetical protein
MPVPPKKYVIVEEEKEWVRRIFDWYARDRHSIQWIVRELNRQKAPKDHRNAKKKWGRAGVRALLRRIKYIGIWPWGITTNCRDPLTGQIYKELRPEEETQGWIRRFPQLRIIDDETFAAAQHRLDKNEEDCAEFRGDDGKLTGSPRGRVRSAALAPGQDSMCGMRVNLLCRRSPRPISHLPGLPQRFMRLSDHVAAGPRQAIDPRGDWPANFV